MAVLARIKSAQVRMKLARDMLGYFYKPNYDSVLSSKKSPRDRKDAFDDFFGDSVKDPHEFAVRGSKPKGPEGLVLDVSKLWSYIVMLPGRPDAHVGQIANPYYHIGESFVDAHPGQDDLTNHFFLLASSLGLSMPAMVKVLAEISSKEITGRGRLIPGLGVREAGLEQSSAKPTEGESKPALLLVLKRPVVIDHTVLYPNAPTESLPAGTACAPFLFDYVKWPDVEFLGAKPAGTPDRFEYPPFLTDALLQDLPPENRLRAAYLRDRWHRYLDVCNEDTNIPPLPPRVVRILEHWMSTGFGCAGSLHGHMIGEDDEDIEDTEDAVEGEGGIQPEPLPDLAQDAFMDIQDLDPDQLRPVHLLRESLGRRARHKKRLSASLAALHHRGYSMSRAVEKIPLNNEGAVAAWLWLGLPEEYPDRADYSRARKDAHALMNCRVPDWKQIKAAVPKNDRAAIKVPAAAPEPPVVEDIETRAQAKPIRVKEEEPPEFSAEEPKEPAAEGAPVEDLQTRRTRIKSDEPPEFLGRG